jgi:hypothetical protein
MRRHTTSCKGINASGGNIINAINSGNANVIYALGSLPFEAVFTLAKTNAERIELYNKWFFQRTGRYPGPGENPYGGAGGFEYMNPLDWLRAGKPFADPTVAYLPSDYTDDQLDAGDGSGAQWFTIVSATSRRAAPRSTVDIMALPSDQEVDNYIAQRASQMGFNPQKAVQVSRAERGARSGGWIGDHGTSFGPFQLHIGGEADNFRRATGLDPRDISGTWRQQVDYVMSTILPQKGMATIPRGCCHRYRYLGWHKTRSGERGSNGHEPKPIGFAILFPCRGIQRESARHISQSWRIGPICAARYRHSRHCRFGRE